MPPFEQTASSQPQSPLRCEDIQARFLSESGLESEAAQAHLASCEVCGALFGGVPPAEEAEAALPEAWKAELLARVRAPATPIERLRESPRAVRAALLGGVCAGVLGAGWATLRSDFATYPLQRMVLVLGVFGLASAVGLMTALWPLWKAPRPWQRFVPPALAALPLAIALLPSPTGGHELSVLSGAAWRHHLACLAWGTLFSMPAVAAYLWVDRLGGKGRMRNLNAVLAAAVLGNAALQLRCPWTANPHLVLGHASVVLSLLAVWAGWQLRISR